MDQMQINGGKNDMYAAWTDAGGLTMGHYTADPSKLPLWKVAQQYVLADNFFISAFGGSFLNHQYLICACAVLCERGQFPAAGKIAVLNADGKSLKVAANSPASALSGPPKFVNDGALTPDFYGINTMQPAYQPSGNKAATGGDPLLADPANPSTMPPQTATNIGDLMTNAGVSWAWYGGAWGQALQASQNGTSNVIYGADLSTPNFQPHHQPFNYFANQAAGHREPRAAPARRRCERRRVHQGDRCGHAAAGRVLQAARQPERAPGLHRRHLRRPAHRRRDRAPAGKPAVEEHGRGRHVRRKRRLLGSCRAAECRPLPGTRIPALIVSPYAKKGFVDHTQYDTGRSCASSRAASLPRLAGSQQRDDALKANGGQPMGDLTNALQLSPNL